MVPAAAHPESVSPPESVTTDSLSSQGIAGFRGPGPTHRRTTGFTLIELALVLIVVALLIGGVLKGWQLVQSSRVRTMAETITSVQSAYFAFSDRFGHVAGDWNAADAGKAIGSPVTGGGDDNGRVDTTALDPWTESNAFWEQLAKAGFIRGTYFGTAATEPTLDNGLTPLNVFRWPIILGRTADYLGATGPRRHVIIGRGVPVAMLRELDVKLDDGQAAEGKIRATVDDAAVSVFVGANRWGGRDAACVDAGLEWDVGADAEDCNALLIF